MNATPDLEQRLRAALSARADLVQPEDLSHVAPVVSLRRRWATPLVVLTGAACVLLVIVLAARLADSRPKAEPASRPDGPQLVLPPDEGRDWKADDLSTPARLDLDGDGTPETVEFLAEPDPDSRGRTRLQTTLSSTGAEAYGVVRLASTIGTTALDPIDADANGDQELVLLRENLDGGPGSPRVPLVFDLRDGLLVEAPPVDRGEFLAGEVSVPGEGTPFYDLVHTRDFWIEDGSLFTSRSRSTFARASMTLLRPESYVVDTYRWQLGEDGVLRPDDAGCRITVPEGSTECGPDPADDLPDITSEATDTIGLGQEVDVDNGVPYTVRLDAVADPSVVVDLADGPQLTAALEIADPEVNTQQPTSVFFDGASMVVTSASDPAVMRVLAQDNDQLVDLEQVGEFPLGNGATTDGRDIRSWLTDNGALVTVVEGADGDGGDQGSWQAWQWQMVGNDQIVALPWGSLCFDDVEDPTTGRRC